MSSRLGAHEATEVTLTFAHRYKLRGGRHHLDGGQVRVSINGGPYVLVPLTSFTANGYNATIQGSITPAIYPAAPGVNVADYGNATLARTGSGRATPCT